jgi:ADP-dependent NAD(P)H-hydrate dehydratase / NAD(P)H-hydrate epimerase
MKVVSGETMQSMDRQTIDLYGVTGLELMERAGRGCAEAIVEHFGTGEKRRAVVMSGKGNNGGDGYVVARILARTGWEVKTIVLARRESVGGDARVNLDRLPGNSVVYAPDSATLEGCREDLEQAGVVVDALFGTGLKSPVSGVYLEAIRMMNGSGRPLVAVDIPSGINATDGAILGEAVRAELTVTFALAKLGHVLYPGVDYRGRLLIVDIGIPEQVVLAASGAEFLDKDAVRAIPRVRSRTAHKGTCGHLLIVAGSTGKSGAAAMAANSAVRGGAGLVTVAVPESIHGILEIKTTEAMTVPLPDLGAGFVGEAVMPVIKGLLASRNAAAIGPGIGWNQSTARLVHEIVAWTKLPLVIDADALNALSENIDLLLRTQASAVIITPHPGEMARLADTTAARVEADRLGVSTAFATRYGVYVVLKGARTVIATPDGMVAVNGSGNPGMASGGMGDVLTGLLGALLAQGYAPFDACRLGVFLHGLAGDLVAAEKGEIGISAVDLQERLPYAFRDLMGC